MSRESICLEINRLTKDMMSIQKGHPSKGKIRKKIKEYNRELNAWDKEHGMLNKKIVVFSLNK